VPLSQDASSLSLGATADFLEPELQPSLLGVPLEPLIRGRERLR